MKRFILITALLVFFPSAGFSHPGGLDSNGGHYDRRSGNYHYHQHRPVINPKPQFDPNKQDRFDAYKFKRNDSLYQYTDD